MDVGFHQVRLQERGRELLVNATTNNVMDVIFCLTIKKKHVHKEFSSDWIPVFFIGPKSDNCLALLVTRSDSNFG